MANALSFLPNKSQGQRDRAIRAFKKHDIDILVATDVAARGIDIPGVNYVYNFNLPEVAENYVHRIGRTARAGAEGKAVAFCAPDEFHLLRQIEKLMSISIHIESGEEPEGMPAKKSSSNNRSRGRNGKPAGGGQKAGGRRGSGHRGQRGNNGEARADNAGGSSMIKTVLLVKMTATKINQVKNLGKPSLQAALLIISPKVENQVGKSLLIRQIKANVHQENLKPIILIGISDFLSQNAQLVRFCTNITKNSCENAEFVPIYYL